MVGPGVNGRCRAPSNEHGGEKHCSSDRHRPGAVPLSATLWEFRNSSRTRHNPP